MQELEQTKARKITIPKRVKRYGVAYYTNSTGWENSVRFFTTPESAIEDFQRSWKGMDDDYTPKFYQVYELDLEIPFIKTSK